MEKKDFRIGMEVIQANPSAPYQGGLKYIVTKINQKTISCMHYTGEFHMKGGKDKPLIFNYDNVKMKILSPLKTENAEYVGFLKCDTMNGVYQLDYLDIDKEENNIVDIEYFLDELHCLEEDEYLICHISSKDQDVYRKIDKEYGVY